MDEIVRGAGPTRRDCLRGLGGLAGAGALAGCIGEPPGSESGDGSYSVTMSPMGEVEFDAVPENVFTVFPQYADMAVALGHGDALNTVYVPEMTGTTMNHYCDHLDGVSFEWEDLADPRKDGLSKEQVYSLESDVHLADPAWASTQDNWDRSDVEDVEQTVGPWFGNFYSGTRADPPDAYAEDYEYYGLWDMFGKVSSVFQEESRYRAIRSIHDDMVATIEEKLPPKDQRPTAVRVTYSHSGGQFWTYHLNEPGYWLADTRPLGADDAFADKDWEKLWGTVDFEAMLEADPDVILHLWGLTPNYDMNKVRSQLENDASGSKLSAVQNDRVFAAGMRYQGPIMNIFQIEMGAKQLYPGKFGEWPGAPDGGSAYPDIPEDEWLFDRAELSDAINGDAE